MLGSIHAFSVLLDPLELRLGIARSQASLLYSGALIALTTAVLLGHHIYRRWSPQGLAMAVTVATAAGIALAGATTSYWLTVAGYSLIFGGANGVGYGFALQHSASALPERSGLAMGVVTAFYACGATIAPFLFSFGINRIDLPATMVATAGVFIVMGSAAAALYRLDAAPALADRADEASASSADSSASRLAPRPTTALLWLGYGAGAMAGLMVIGHATPIIESVGGASSIAVVTTAAIAAANMAGGLGAGALGDRLSTTTLLIALPAISALVLLAAAITTSAIALATGLVVVGGVYGAIIAVYPAAVRQLAGAQQSARLYGRVFTSWGAAGLAGPWLAGLLFERTGGYQTSLVIAGLVSLVSTAAVVALRPG